MPIPEPPRFLQTADRTVKPRRSGITHVIDTGMPLAGIEALVEAYGAFVDVWKFGFGTAYLDAAIASKIELLQAHDIKACPGGTLLEAAWWQGRSEEFFGWAHALGFDCVEVSRGATGMPPSAKLALIAAARDHTFEVFAEVGSKDPGEPARPEQWLEEARCDIDSGACWLVAEGRESGTVGLYTADGLVRADLVDALEGLGPEAPVVFEAPRREQQAWLVNRLGTNVNLANVSGDEVLALEALRRGLRSDTLRMRLPVAGGAGALGPSPRPVEESAPTLGTPRTP